MYWNDAHTFSDMTDFDMTDFTVIDMMW